MDAALTRLPFIIGHVEGAVEFTVPSDGEGAMFTMEMEPEQAVVIADALMDAAKRAGWECPCSGCQQKRMVKSRGLN